MNFTFLDFLSSFYSLSFLLLIFFFFLSSSSWSFTILAILSSFPFVLSFFFFLFLLLNVCTTPFCLCEHTILRIFRTINLSLVSGSLYDLGVSSFIGYMWGFGSLLGFFFFLQVVSGFFLSLHYSSYASEAFSSVIHIVRDVDGGFFFRSFHINGASFFFVFIYFHIGRGLYYNSGNLTYVWFSGVTSYLFLIIIAFLGYVLPWGQISFWGATVITNLLSIIPYLGVELVKWIWGGYSVSGITLTRFFSLHFIIPFLLAFVSFIHLYFLHSYGSSSLTSLDSFLDKVSFFPYYGVSDLLGFSFFLIIFFYFVFVDPYFLADPENFSAAEPLNTPLHIQPEWYFLFAYSILRSVPGSAGGALFLLLSVLILYLVPIFSSDSSGYFFLNRIFFYFFVSCFFILTWVGMCPAEYPFDTIGLIFSYLYFTFFFLLFIWALSLRLIWS